LHDGELSNCVGQQRVEFCVEFPLYELINNLIVASSTDFDEECWPHSPTSSSLVTIAALNVITHFTLNSGKFDENIDNIMCLAYIIIIRHSLA